MTLKKNWLAVSVFVFALGLYVYTLAPGWGAVNIFNTWDGLEYVLCSSLFGIDHPPGHPFYLILLKVFTSLLFIGSAAWRVNFFSALCGALTAAAAYLVVELSLRLIGKPGDPLLQKGTAVISAAMLAFSKVFWTHSVIPEVHTLYLFLMSLLFYSVLRYIENNEVKWLTVFALVSGLIISTSLFNALTVVFPAGLVVIFLYVTEKRKIDPKHCLISASAFIGGLLLYLYYPIAGRMNPGFIHPMNLMTKHALGSLSWFLWYASGKAWTGSGMFSLGRVMLNIPNFLRHNIDNFTILSLFLFALALAYAVKLALEHRSIFNLPASLKVLLLIMFTYLIVALPQLSLQDPSNPGSTTYIYVANFFLPSFLIFVFASGIGLGLVVDFVEERQLLKKLFELFNRSGEIRPESRRALVLLLLYVLFILPMYLLAINYRKCDLKGKDTGYRFAAGILSSLPRGSVVYSKLVFQLVGTYFERVEKIMPAGWIEIENPDLIGKEILLSDLTAMDSMIEKTDLLKEGIAESLGEEKSVYISGDCVDQDKAPEILLISDLNLRPSAPRELILSMTTPYPTELIPYRVESFVEARPVHGDPEIEERGLANDGNFADTIELLGFSAPREEISAIGRNVIALDFYWKVLDRVPQDLIGLVTVFNEQLLRVAPGRAEGFFTLGGTYRSSKWRAGETIKERVYYYLPNLPAGRYFLALGLLKPDGKAVPFYPSDRETQGREFDFVLLTPFGIGPQTPLPRR